MMDALQTAVDMSQNLPDPPKSISLILPKKLILLKLSDRCLNDC